MAKLRVSEIQERVLSALRAVRAHILHSTIYALSSEPDDPQYDPTVRQNTVIVGAIMTKAQAFAFRAACNVVGVWVRWTFWSIEGDSERFEYSLTCTEQWGPPPVVLGMIFGLALYFASPL